MSVLLLNASFQPLHVITARRAVLLVLAGKAEVVVTDPEGIPIRSARLVLERPAVVRLMEMVKVIHRTPTLTRRALIARDGGQCQRAGCVAKGTTIDHVVPRSAGGEHRWTNVVLMCERCNWSKGAKTLDQLGWSLRRAPFEPRHAVALLAAAGGEMPPLWGEWLAVA